MINRGNKTPEPLVVKTKSGDEISLQIDMGKSGRFPKLNKNQLVDGARASVEVTLNEDGTVAKASVVESYPAPVFGESLKDAILTWTFVLPDGVSGLDVAPFEHDRVFYVRRR